MNAIEKFKSCWNNEEAKLIIEWYKEISKPIKIYNIIKKLDDTLRNEIEFLDNGYKLYLEMLFNKLLNEDELNEIVVLNSIIKEIKENNTLID